MATNFSPCYGSYVLNQFPIIVMFGMKGFHVSASRAIQGHHGPLVTMLIRCSTLAKLSVCLFCCLSGSLSLSLSLSKRENFRNFSHVYYMYIMLAHQNSTELISGSDCSSFVTENMLVSL